MRPWDDCPEPRQGLCYVAKINPADIAHVVALTEGHEGLAVIRTKDAALGIVEFWVPPTMQQDFESYLDALRQEVGLVANPPVVLDLEQVERENQFRRPKKTD